ncbi:MAG: hypothetical protein QW247_06025 [Pyrobaculum sp.]
MSTKARKEVVERLRRHNANTSEVLRRALEELGRREEEEAKKSALRISQSLGVSAEDVAKMIREIRNER